MLSSLRNYYPVANLDISFLMAVLLSELYIHGASPIEHYVNFASKKKIPHWTTFPLKFKYNKVQPSHSIFIRYIWGHIFIAPISVDMEIF